MKFCQKNLKWLAVLKFSVFFDCAISTISAKKFVKQTGCLQPSNLSWYRLKLYCNILSSTVLKMNGLDFSQHPWALVNGFEIENYVGISPEKKKFQKKFLLFKKQVWENTQRIFKKSEVTHLLIFIPLLCEIPLDFYNPLSSSKTQIIHCCCVGL